MKPGPPPKPSQIKRLAGTLRADRANPAEAVFPVPGRMPSPPDYLSESATAIWRTLGRALLTAGLLTDADRLALAMLCAALGRWIDAERALQSEGPVLYSAAGNPYQNPWLSVANRSWTMARAMLPHFGLTPAERGRVTAMIAQGEPETLAEVLFRGVSDGR